MVRFARVGVAACFMCHPQVLRSHQRTRYNGGNTLKSQDNRKGLRAPPLNWVECDPTHLARLASPHGVVTDGHVVLDRRDPPGSAGDPSPDPATSALWAEPAPAGSVLHAWCGLDLQSSPASITAQRVGAILPSPHP